MTGRERPSDGSIVRRTDGCWREADLLAALEAAVAALGEHAAQLDATNVFPVADRDTGTNLLLTAQAALRGARSAAGRGLAAVARAAADAALRAAHGNSGLLLSQVFRAFAEMLDGRDELDAAVLAAALARADELARRALLHPVEGTMITVLRAAAQAAQRALAPGTTVADLLLAVRTAALETVQRTPEYLPVLRAHGVVDAGAQGLAVLLAAWVALVHGETARLQPTPAHGTAPADGHGFCVNALVLADGADADRVAAELARYGDSLDIVRDRNLLRVHLHTDRPDAALELLRTAGRLESVVIDDLSGKAAPLALLEPRPVVPLVLSPAPRIATLAHRLGYLALRTSDRDWTVEELARQLSDLPVTRVTVLPGGARDVELAETLARQLERPRLDVVPIRSLAAQLVAMLLLEDQSEEPRAPLETVLSRLRTADIERLPGGRWRASGAGGDLDSTGDEVVGLVVRTLAALGAAGAELCTLVVGRELPRVEPLRAAIAAQWPQLQLEWFWGDQPAPALSLALER
ncbi:MAG: DAK2 domain-containing protein [Thermomicrobium sp.]|nr:DAK2 domain-containing protein [Thermomicrobium sp.]